MELEDVTSGDLSRPDRLRGIRHPGVCDARENAGLVRIIAEERASRAFQAHHRE